MAAEEARGIMIGDFTNLGRIFFAPFNLSVTNCLLVLCDEPSLKVKVKTDNPAIDSDLRYSIFGIPLQKDSKGLVTLFSTCSEDRPGASV